MPLQVPDSIDGLVYFSRRALADDKGKAITWVPKLPCPKCKKGLMGKPVEKGKVRIRASEYTCSKCGYSEEKKAHEAKLNALIIYDCPFPNCGKHGEATVPFARKSFYGKKAIVFACASCGEKLGITKKLSSAPDFVAKVQGKNAKASKDVVDTDEDDEF
jgi:predicted RNA-binding Zn-ribbon protein involved in translation (DUF1610 family)